jgi:tRNA-dihydrouridine synthase
VDGVMMGRAAIGNPWIFNQIKNGLENLRTTNYEPPTISDRIEVCRIHLQKSIEWKGARLGIIEMRKHYANYFKGVENFKEFRMKLVTLDHFDEISGVLNSIEEKYNLLQPA